MNRNLALGTVFAVLLILVGVLLYLNFFSATARAPRAGQPRASGAPSPGHASAGPTSRPGGASSPRVKASSVTSPSPAPAAASPAAIATPSRPAGRVMKLVLYFQGPDVGLLFPEEREVEETPDGNLRARAVLEELTKGPRKDLLPTVPVGTRVREVYFDVSGVAFVDFSRELRDRHPGGAAEELLTIDSIVNSLARNVPQVLAVQFLIEGRTVASLAGHVDLSAPVRPESDRLAATR